MKLKKMCESQMNTFIKVKLVKAAEEHAGGGGARDDSQNS